MSGLKARLALAGTDEIRYRSPREMELDSIAESLGEAETPLPLPEWKPPADYAEIEMPRSETGRLDRFGATLGEHLERLADKRRRRRRVRRRRIAIFGVATVLVCGVVGAAAGALTGAPADLPGVGQLLDNSGAEKAQGPPVVPLHLNRDSGMPLLGPDTNVSVAVPSGYDTRTHFVTAYMRGDYICAVSSGKQAEGVNLLANAHSGGCGLYRPLVERLSDELLVFAGISGEIPRDVIGDTPPVVLRRDPTTILFAGYAAGDVRSVDLMGPEGSLTTRLSEAWAPNAAGAMPLRLFVGIAEYPDVRSGGRVTRRSERLGDFREYAAEGRMADGRVVRVEF
jgi:hypothetical protein